MSWGNPQRGLGDEGSLLVALPEAEIRAILFLKGTQVAYHTHYTLQCYITSYNFADRMEEGINIAKACCQIAI